MAGWTPCTEPPPEGTRCIVIDGRNATPESMTWRDGRWWWIDGSWALLDPDAVWVARPERN